MFERLYYPGTHDAKGSGGTPGYYYYVQVASNLSATSLSITGLKPATSTSGSHTYAVASVDSSTSPATISPYSALGTGAPMYAPALNFALLGGAVVSQASVEIGSTVQITPLWSGNPTPTFSLTGAPATMTIDPTTKLVSYSPLKGESGNITVQINATNPLGKATENFTFIIIQQPTVQVTGGTFTYDGNVHPATAVALDNSGQPLAGTFSFEYAPAQYPNSYSSSPYAEPGTYLVRAIFTSGDASYGTATGTGEIIITSTGQTATLNLGPTAFISLSTDQSTVNYWDNADGSGPVAQQFSLSDIAGFIFTSAASGTSLTVDYSNGNPLPTNGLSFIGSGIASGNVLNLIGTPTGNDAIAGTIGTISVNGGTITYSNVGGVQFNVGQGTDQLVLNGGSLTIPVANSTGITTDNFSNISIGNGASLIFASSTTSYNRTLVDAASFNMAGNIGAWTGSLDLGNNDLEIQSGNLSQISSELYSGQQVATGIFSSFGSANSSHLTSLGSVQLAAPGVFDGQSAAAGSILAKYTYFGDATLNGTVDGSDYSRIDSAILTQATGWNNGDFNYDGVINGSDYTLIDNAFNRQSASLAALISSDGLATITLAKLTNVPTTSASTSASITDSFFTDRKKTIAYGLLD